MERTKRTAWHKAFLISIVISAASAALEVDHSIGGSGFRPAGKLVGNLLSDTELEWHRPALTSNEMEILEKAAESDGLYSVRIRTDKGTVLSSVPAKCLLQGDFAEQVMLAAGQDGFIEAFNYDVKSCSSASASSAAAGGSGAAGSSASSSGTDLDVVGGAVGRPERLTVRVMRPSVGPMLSVPELAGEFVDVPVDEGHVGAGLGAAAYDPNAKPRAVPGGGSGGQAGARKGGPPPKDERSWLQKNWLIVVALGMMVLNVVAKANVPPQQQQGGPGPAAGAGAAARRG